MRPDANNELRIAAMISFTRYLSWADLQRTLFEEEMGSEPGADDPSAMRNHEWRWFGLMSYWYASLYVVIEAWDNLGYVDPIVSQLLSQPSDLRMLLRRFRNGVFHYQESLLTPKILDLLETGSAHVYWVWALHQEIVRAFEEHLEQWMVTDELRVDIRRSMESIVNWYPHTLPSSMESLGETIIQAHQILLHNPDDGSEARRSLKEAFEGGLRVLNEGKQKWPEFRAEILRKAGIK